MRADDCHLERIDASLGEYVQHLSLTRPCDPSRIERIAGILAISSPTGVEHYVAGWILHHELIWYLIGIKPDVEGCPARNGADVPIVDSGAVAAGLSRLPDFTDVKLLFAILRCPDDDHDAGVRQSAGPVVHGCNQAVGGRAEIRMTDHSAGVAVRHGFRTRAGAVRPTIPEVPGEGDGRETDWDTCGGQREAVRGVDRAAGQAGRVDAQGGNYRLLARAGLEP